MLIRRHHRAFETTLPDMAGGRRSLMVMPGVGHGQRLQDAADGLPGGRLQDQMEVVVHQAIRVQPEGIAFLGLDQSVKELLKVGVVEKDAGAVIATIERVVNKDVGDQSRLSSHASSLGLGENKGKKKNELTPISLQPCASSGWSRPADS